MSPPKPASQGWLKYGRQKVPESELPMGPHGAGRTLWTLNFQLVIEGKRKSWKGRTRKGELLAGVTRGSVCELMRKQELGRE